MSPMDATTDMPTSQQGLDTTTAKQKPATRQSLACLTCRQKHHKCDGKQPSCTRCNQMNLDCVYAQSRRGGSTRAALTERRRRQAGKSGASMSGSSETASIQRRHQPRGNSTNDRLELSLLDGNVSFDLFTTPLTESSGIGNDPLINAYYENFHMFHPFVLPKSFFEKFHQDPVHNTKMAPLSEMMRLIGAIYTSKDWSVTLQQSVDNMLAQSRPPDLYLVQCRMLYCVALFWHLRIDEAKVQVGIARDDSLALGLHLEEFTNGETDEHPVLKESSRRTWWQLYIIDGYVDGTLGTMDYRLFDVPATAHLPCELHEYETGLIPNGMTLEDFDDRELAPEDIHFSSMAYLVGAARVTATAMLAVADVNPEDLSLQVMQRADSAFNGWVLSLPKDRNQLMDKQGEPDEMMIQAHLLIHVAIIVLHRPLSDLKYHTIETISSCARDSNTDKPAPNLVNIHTFRVLRSVEAQVRILALPTSRFSHSPFLCCMLSEGCLALLSACRFLFEDKKILTARDQIKLTLGCLKALGEVWPRITKSVKELQTIARHVLGKESVAFDKEAPNRIQKNGHQFDEEQPVLLTYDSLAHDDLFLGLDLSGNWWDINDIAPVDSAP